jgi:DNA-binding response OmpR family regulator
MDRAGMAWSTGPDYQRLRVVIGDCAPELAAAVESGLRRRGVHDIVVCDTAESLFHALDERVIDFLLYDYHLLGARFVETMQKIRRKDVGRNPFITVVATIRETSLETIQRVIDGGVDDLIRSPASPDRIFARIDKSIRRRKPFTVSYDYVGPARPAAHGGKTAEAARLRVPNTLKNRLIDQHTDGEIDSAVFKASVNMRTRQMQSCGAEIDSLARRVADICHGSEAGEDRRAMRVALEKIGVVADDLRVQASGMPTEGVANLAATLMPVAQRIVAAPPGEAEVEVQLLAQLAAAIRRALATEAESLEPAIREIAAAVGGFARRSASPEPLSAP